LGLSPDLMLYVILSLKPQHRSQSHEADKARVVPNSL